MSLQFQMVQEGRLIYIPVALSDEQKRAIEAIYDLYSQDDTLKKNNVDAFMGNGIKDPTYQGSRNGGIRYPLVLSSHQWERCWHM
jgi:hypothetical protein